MKLIGFSIAALLLSQAVYSHEVEYLHAPQHQHGTGDISLLWQATDSNTQLTVTAVYAGQDVVKFEHLPKNAAEKRQVREAYQQFIDQPVITANGCKPNQVNVSSALFAEHANNSEKENKFNNFISNLLGQSDDATNSGEITIPEHMDFAAVYTFLCDKNHQALQFQHFATFPSLQQVRVHQNDIKQATSQILTPKESQITGE